MHVFAKKLLALTMYTMALAIIPGMTLAKAGMGSSKHIKKHKMTDRSPVIRAPRPTQAWPDSHAWPNSQSPSQP